MMTYQDLLKTLFLKAVEVADPMQSLKEALPEKPQGRVIVVGAGKASARMAEAVEQVWGACDGLVITRYGYGRPCKGVKIIEAAHPVPDEAGRNATHEMLKLLETAREDDFVLALISGGASALLTAPAGHISLEEKQALNKQLLSSGAPITQMNTVRKHLSRVKGGQLAAAAYPANMLTLMISDIPGDDPAFIGSGPTVGDDSSVTDAKAILAHWSITPSQSILDVLNTPSGVIPTHDKRLSTTKNVIYAAPSQSLEAAAILAKAKGFDVEILGDAIEGEAREVAKTQIEYALTLAKKTRSKPLILMSGGELTVTQTGTGIGGPNAEFVLAAAIAAQNHPRLHILACDTDGVDGAAEVAGAYAGPDTLINALNLKIDPLSELNNNNAHRFFEQLNQQVVTGPTLTNVNDFRVILIA